jgi:SAM-dependent methyltransferase
MRVEEYERMFRAEETHWWYVGMRAISLALLGQPREPAPRLLDAGCGTGSNLVQLRARGRPVGVDLSEEALEFCKSRNVAVTRASLLALPFADDCFDEITSFDVLYHEWVTDDRAAIREMIRVLRPGGLLLLRVPALRALWGAHDEAVQSRHRYTRTEVVRLLADAGLEVRRATYANCFLLPLLAVRRTLDRLTLRTGSDVEFLPPAVDRFFRGLLLLEARLIRSISLPLGASVFALAHKPEAPPRGRC